MANHTLPGFVADISGHQAEAGLYRAHVSDNNSSDSMSIMPSMDGDGICQYYPRDCHRICSKRGGDYEICMCLCHPGCFCEPL
jgi:hypothetical protein